jgi:hypothetical protein
MINPTQWYGHFGHDDLNNIIALQADQTLWNEIKMFYKPALAWHVCPGDLILLRTNKRELPAPVLITSNIENPDRASQRRITFIPYDGSTSLSTVISHENDLFYTCRGTPNTT